MSVISPTPLAPAACSAAIRRSEEHTSELQSRPHLVCRLLLEKKKKARPHRWERENRRTRHRQPPTARHVSHRSVQPPTSIRESPTLLQYAQSRRYTPSYTHLN